MKTRLVAPLALLSLLAGCLDVATGVRATESRTVTSFHAVQVGSAVEAELAVGPAAVVLTGDQGLLQHLRTDVDAQGLLVIELEPGILLPAGEHLRATVSAPALDGVTASGAAVVSARDLQASTVQLTSSGAAHLDVTGLAATSVQIQATGASRLTVAGSAVTGDYLVRGSSEVDARSVSVQQATIQVSGSSSLVLTATGTVSGSVTGASTVKVAGQPALNLSVEGSSSVGTP